jgi:serine/threonine-protein kinase
MSPEQARGREADKQSDLWAFGCVVYEMLTARRPFGPTVDEEAAGDSSRRASDELADTLAAVLTKEPDWTALPATVPPALRVLLRRCLQKERRQRIGDVAAALVLIEEVGALGASGSLDEAAVQPRLDAAVARARTHLQHVMRVRMAVIAVGAILLGGGIVGGGTWLATRPAPPRVLQLTIGTTPATALTINGSDRDVAITPDGAHVIYAGNNGTELFVRALDALEPARLYSGAPRAPIVSPDGQWVAFVDESTTLKKVAITGGPPVTLAALDGFSRGATWLPDDTIVFGTSASGTGLQQVAARGGPVTVLTRPDRARGEADHVWPEALPGGRAVLFTILPATGGIDAAQIAVLDLQTQAQTMVVRGGSHAHYVASGHLVYAAGGTLRAIAFNPATRTTRGVPVAVVPDVVTTGTAPAGGVEAALAADGTLAYVRGTGVTGLRTLAWVDRQGRETALAAPPRPYIYPRISPDGGRVVVYSADQDTDLWVWDVARLTLTRLTVASGQDTFPVWAPDGRVLFSSERDGALNLYAQAADGTGVAERWTTSPNAQNATAVTPDGTRLLFMERGPTTGDDVRQVSVTGPHTVTPLVETAAAERNGIVSPDGRWLAYEANDSGSFEIYVRPYPDVASGRWQVSTGGGSRPLWSRDGRELFYVSPRNALLRVGVGRGASWTATTPDVVLADGSVTSPAGLIGRSYDVSPDGQRFLMLKAASAPNATPTQLVVVQHFDALLRRLVPTN